MAGQCRTASVGEGTVDRDRCGLAPIHATTPRDIAIIDEMPNQVHEHLVLEGAPFYFLPLPDSDKGEDGAEARPLRELPSANHGLRVEVRHRDARLQTPFRQKDLDRDRRYHP